MKLITIGANEAGQRLDKFLNKYLDAAGKGFLYKMLRKKNITLNGKKAEGMEMLHPGDEVRLFLSDETIAKFHTVKQRETAPAVSLDIIYEDRNILLINKPAGMLSQKARPEDISLCEYLTEDLLRRGELTERGASSFPAGRLQSPGPEYQWSGRRRQVSDWSAGHVTSSSGALRWKILSRDRLRNHRREDRSPGLAEER